MPEPVNPLDAMARKAGFHDYATMQAWQAHQSQSLRTQNYMVENGAPQAVPKPQPQVDQRSWYQRLFDGMGGK